MMRSGVEAVLRHLRHTVGPAGGLTDGELLGRWVGRRDEAALEVLLWRHGPMVLGVCRRVLRREQDAEDAFQATFLTLVRRAANHARSPLAGRPSLARDAAGDRLLDRSARLRSQAPVADRFAEAVIAANKLAPLTGRVVTWIAGNRAPEAQAMFAAAGFEPHDDMRAALAAVAAPER